MVEENIGRNLKMNRRSRNIILLFLLFLSCSCYAGRPCKTRTASRINNVGIELPRDVVAKMYDFYEEPYYARVLIDSVYTFGGASKNGIYTFRVCYQPHYPEKCVVVLNSNAYCVKNEGFAYRRGVVEEVCSIIQKTKCDNTTMMEILKGVYIYIYEQYGLHYGRDFIPNDPPVLETTEEKERYILSKLSDQHKLYKLKDSLFADLQQLPDKLSALVKEMQGCDIIFLLRILTNFKVPISMVDCCPVNQNFLLIDR